MPIRKAQRFAAFILILGFIGIFNIPVHADWLFWLDGPNGRSNPHDPKSPFFKPPTPAASATPSATISPTQSPNYTSTVTPTVSASPTGTMSSTPSPTATPTPLIYYDGENPGASLAANNRALVQAVGYLGSTLFAETGAGGAHGGASYLALSMAAQGSYVVEGPSNTPGAYCDISAYNALSLWVRSPDACFAPVVILHSPNTCATCISTLVSFVDYTPAGAMLPGQWQQAIIPLSVFSGINSYTGSTYSLAANGNLIDAVGLMPPEASYSTNGYDTFPANALATAPAWTCAEIDIDDVTFINIAPPAACSFPRCFDPFINVNGRTAWEGIWSTGEDTATCLAPSSSWSFPASGGLPIDAPPALAGNTLAACYVGHISGVLGAAAGASPCTSTDLSQACMKAGMISGGTSVDLASALGFTPQGVKFFIAKGPTAATAMDVDFTLQKLAVQSTPDYLFADYRHKVTASQLASGNWIQVTVPFPVTGANGTDDANSFGQPSWAAAHGDSVPWSTSDIIGVRIGPDEDSRGLPFDIYVDHIEFY